MTLRHQVSLILRFGRLVDRGQHTCPLTLDAELCAVTLSRDFAIIGSLAILSRSTGRRPMTLRRRVFPVLLFLGAILFSRFSWAISIRQAF